METNEPSPASETSPAAFVKTEEENSKISGRNYLRWSGRVRSTRGQAIEAWELYKSNPSRVTWGGLSRDQYISCPKLASSPLETYFWTTLKLSFPLSRPTFTILETLTTKEHNSPYTLLLTIHKQDHQSACLNLWI